MASRIKAAGNGDVVTRFAAELARTDPIISHVAKRAFVKRHPEGSSSAQRRLFGQAARVEAAR